MMRPKQLIILSYGIVIILWVGISFFRMANNLGNLVKDFRLLSLSDGMRKEIVYGTIYDFRNFVEQKTPARSEIIFLSSGAKPFYFCRYQLYPRKLYFARTIKEVEDMKRQGRYDYLLIYKSSNPLENENQSSKWNLNNFSSKDVYRSDTGDEGRVIPL